MDKPAETKKVTCAVCRAEIPKAAALHAEGKDYVYHFCDAACFEHWDEEKEAEPEKP
jgi:YHS domain-containing protein